MGGLSAAQMEMRRSRIGSSEVGAILGIDPYKSDYEVFADKTLPEEGQREDHRSWGMDLEPAILRHHARVRGYELLPPPGSLIHPALPLVCTPDALALAGGGIVDLQAKNDQGHGQIEWGEPGTDDAPLLYVAQVTAEIGVLRAAGHNVSHGELAVTIRGAPPVAYRIDFREALFGDIAELCAKWVRDHLATGKPPKGTAPEVAEYIRRKYARHDERVLEPTPELEALVQGVTCARSTCKAAEEAKTEAENALKNAIGDAAGIAGLCTWRAQKRAAHAVKESTSRVLRLTKVKEG